MLTNHAIKRCQERNIDASKLDQCVINKNFIISLTQPDGCQICWCIINGLKIYFIYGNEKVITVIDEVPQYMKDVIKGKRSFKNHSKESNKSFMRKKNRELKSLFAEEFTENDS